MAQIAFRPDYGSKQNPPNEHIIDAAWQVAFSMLWQGQCFQPHEIERIKQEIRNYFQSTCNEREAFTSFCERMAMALTLPAKEGCSVPHPSIWFNPHCEEGFAATQSLCEDTQGEPSHLNPLAHLLYDTILLSQLLNPAQ